MQVDFDLPIASKEAVIPKAVRDLLYDVADIFRVHHVHLGRVIYVGVTGDLDQRVYQHKHETVLGFTSKYHVDRLVYMEAFADPRDAIAREKEIKGWRREKKVALIEKKNPTWADIAESWPEAKKERKKERKSRSLTLKGGFGMTPLSFLVGRESVPLGQR